MPRFMVSSARVLLYVLSALTMHSALAKDSDALSGPALYIETFNLRYDNPADGANAWPKRQTIVKQHIQQTHPDVIGMQEVLVHQLNWLQENLPAYTAIGVGRDRRRGASQCASGPVPECLHGFRLAKSGS